MTTHDLSRTSFAVSRTSDSYFALTQGLVALRHGKPGDIERLRTKSVHGAIGANLIVADRTSSNPQTTVDDYILELPTWDTAALCRPKEAATQPAGSSRQLLDQLKAKFRFTWEQLADVMNVDVRSVHLWRRGGRLSAAREERLHVLGQLVTDNAEPVAPSARPLYHRWLGAGGDPKRLLGKSEANQVDLMQTFWPYIPVFEEAPRRPTRAKEGFHEARQLKTMSDMRLPQVKEEIVASDVAIVRGERPKPRRLRDD